MGKTVGKAAGHFRMNTTFLLNGEKVSATTDPTTTLLDWLRETRNLTGTKEGCNEGDCGACTVMVSDDNGPRALNACILFVPQLHGKSVRTNLIGVDVIEVRPNAFMRIIDNLFSNACRYSDEISLISKCDLNSLVFTIDDDGPGIPIKHYEDVFRPFYRLDEARNLNESGTGLGLSIARDIARSHGGDITLSKSELGGLRATLRIPL